MLDIGRKSFNFNCPSCGSRNSATLNQVANQQTIKCIGCSSGINLKDNNGSAKRSLRDINNSLEDLKNVFKKIGR